jgi:hypothetical protein
MSLKIRGGRFKNVLPYLLSSFGFLLGIVLNFILARVLGPNNTERFNIPYQLQ